MVSVLQRFSRRSDVQIPNRDFNHCIVTKKASLLAIVAELPEINRIRYISHNNNSIITISTFADSPCITTDNIFSFWVSKATIARYFRTSIKVFINLNCTIRKLIKVIFFYRKRNFNTIVFLSIPRAKLIQLWYSILTLNQSIHGHSAIVVCGDVELVSICQWCLGTDTEASGFRVGVGFV